MQGFDPPSLDRVRDDVDSLRPRLALKRRAFVATSLGAGFAAAVLPVQARTMIVTDAQGHVLQEAAAVGPGDRIEARLARGRFSATVVTVTEDPASERTES